jgi:hypothetical protein
MCVRASSHFAFWPLIFQEISLKSISPNPPDLLPLLSALSAATDRRNGGRLRDAFDDTPAHCVSWILSLLPSVMDLWILADLPDSINPALTRHRSCPSAAFWAQVR